MAVTLLKSTFKEAAFHIIHTNGMMTRQKRLMMETSKQTMAFIMGTGLEVMLQSYGMEYNADELRSSFYHIFHIKKSA